MKNITKYLLVLLLALCSLFIETNAQVAINENGDAPDASAMLDVGSTDRGLLIPRLDSTARKNIASPANGLMVYDSTTNTFWYYKDAWQEIGGAFISRNGTTSSINNNDDFIFGADNLNYGSGTETKFFFDKGESAFRVGTIRNNDWDTDSLGAYSFGAGLDIKASGLASIAIGNRTTASGDFSISFGGSTTASDTYAVAFGSSTSATSLATTAFGTGTEASANFATAFGVSSIASGNNATAFGRATKATARFSTAFGTGTEANGEYSTAFGNNVITASYSEIAIGLFNTIYTPADTSNFDSSDRLFVIGNGTSTSDRSDALRIYKSGNVDLFGALTIDSAYTLPIMDGLANQVLTTDGDGTLNWTTNNGAFNSENGLTSSLNNDDDFIFGADSLNYNGLDVERKFFFDKSTGAFRAGQINNNNWDMDSLGLASLAFGSSTKATASYSTALGREAIASGYAATAIGDRAEASDYGAIAIGNETKATASYATALGRETTASSFAATAIGNRTEASDYAATAMGNRTIASGFAATSMGRETEASGYVATAIGNRTEASGTLSVAIGDGTTASGFISTALGSSTTASGYVSTALGFSTKATGSISSTFGNTTTAISYSETAMGMYNTTYIPNDSFNYDDEDRLFVLGNGRSSNELSDALIIYKNGNTELNGALTIDSSYTLPVTDGTTGQFLQTDGSGNVNWANQQTDTDDQTIDKFELSGNTLLISLEDDGQSDISVDLTPLIDDLVPVGTIQMWPTSTAPSGWLICNGSSFNASTYPELNSVLGGNMLPNFNGRFPLGVGNSGTTGSTSHSIKSTGGEEKHFLTIGEMPSHNHGITYTGRNKSGSGGEVSDLESSSSTTTTENTGGNQAHNNMPPFYTVNFIIKAE